ncbi:MAG TPA: hypothetical protein PLZ57_04220 [Pseudobdellovibrionaceae bacterium]|nr:hypothetical protein [Pseudobdellovibrionaceae bacterium]
MSGQAPRLIWLNFLGEEAWRNWSLPWATPWRRQSVAAWDEVGWLLAEPNDVYLSRVQPTQAWSEERQKQWPLGASQKVRRVQFENFTKAYVHSQSEFVFVQVSPDEVKLVSELGMNSQLMDRLRIWNDKRHWPSWVRAMGFQTPDTWKLKEVEQPAYQCGRLKLAWSSGGAGQVVWRTADEYAELRRAYLGATEGDQQGISSIIPSDEWIAQREIESPTQHWTVSFHLFDAFKPVAAQVTYDREFHSLQHRLMSLDLAPMELRNFAKIWRSSLMHDLGDAQGKWRAAAGFDAIEDAAGNFWIVDLNARLDRVGLVAWIAERHGLCEQDADGRPQLTLPMLSRWRGQVKANSSEELARDFLREFGEWNLHLQPIGVSGASEDRSGRSRCRILHFGVVDSVANSQQDSQVREFAVEIQIMHTPLQDALGWMSQYFERRRPS